MSKYHVIHGTVTLGTGKGDDVERKHYEVGETFEMSDEEAKPLLKAGTVGKGPKLKDGEEPPVNNPLAPTETTDVDAARAAASEGAPDGSQDTKAAGRDLRASLKK